MSMFYMRHPFIFVFLLGVAPTAFAWEQNNQCTPSAAEDEYTSNSFTYNISTTDFPAVGDNYVAIRDAGPRWGDGVGNPIKGTDVSIQQGANTTINNSSWFDGFNSVTMETYLPSCFIAQAIERCSGGVVVECDIRFESIFTVACGGTGLGTNWTGGVAEKGSHLSLRAAFIHELGHCLGFAHEQGFPDTMNSSYPFASNIGGKTTVASSARQGVRIIYPDTTTGTDLAVSILRKSTEGDTDWIPFVGDGIVEATTVKAGGKIIRKYCVYNLGTSAVSDVYIKVYLSDDAIIETTDSTLEVFVDTIYPGQPLCKNRTIDIPGGAIPGTYWLGAIVDPSDFVIEDVESNNTVVDTHSIAINL